VKSEKLSVPETVDHEKFMSILERLLNTPPAPKKTIQVQKPKKNKANKSGS
jgi:hypothetical protein